MLRTYHADDDSSLPLIVPETDSYVERLPHANVMIHYQEMHRNILSKAEQAFATYMNNLNLNSQIDEVDQLYMNVIRHARQHHRLSSNIVYRQLNEPENEFVLEIETQIRDMEVECFVNLYMADVYHVLVHMLQIAVRTVCREFQPLLHQHPDDALMTTIMTLREQLNGVMHQNRDRPRTLRDVEYYTLQMHRHNLMSGDDFIGEYQYTGTVQADLETIQQLKQLMITYMTDLMSNGFMADTLCSLAREDHDRSSDMRKRRTDMDQSSRKRRKPLSAQGCAARRRKQERGEYPTTFTF